MDQNLRSISRFMFDAFRMEWIQFPPLDSPRGSTPRPMASPMLGPPKSDKAKVITMPRMGPARPLLELDQLSKNPPHPKNKHVLVTPVLVGFSEDPEQKKTKKNVGWSLVC